MRERYNELLLHAISQPEVTEAVAAELNESELQRMLPHEEFKGEESKSIGHQASYNINSVVPTSNRPRTLNEDVLLIEIKSMQTAHELGKPLCGRLKLCLKKKQEAFKKLTLTVTG